jgi:hypothetical protein
VDPDLAVAELGGKAQRAFLADEARTGSEIEAPAVVGASERFPEHDSLDKGVALVRTGVLEGVNLATDREDGDLAAVGFHDRAPLLVEPGKWNREPLHAT